MCAAKGCPNRWSLSIGGEKGTCSAHAWALPREWPEITRQLLDGETDRALRNAVAESQPAPRPLGRIERQQLMHRLRTMGSGQVGRRQGKAWAEELQQRHARGEKQTPAQVECWQGALGVVARAPAHLPTEELAWDEAA
jgi:hypothetical protein